MLDDLAGSAVIKTGIINRIERVGSPGIMESGGSPWLRQVQVSWYARFLPGGDLMKIPIARTAGQQGDCGQSRQIAQLFHLV